MTQDSKVLMGSQEAEASPETLDPWGPQARRPEMKVMECHSVRTYLVSGMDVGPALLAPWLPCDSICPRGVSAPRRARARATVTPARLDHDTDGSLNGGTGVLSNGVSQWLQPQAIVEAVKVDKS